MKQIYYWLFVIGLVAFSACKKKGKDEVPPPPPPPPPPTITKLDLLRDSVYLYSKEVYLWQEKIPTYDVFNPRQFTGSTDLAAADKVMDKVSSYQPLDRFSFVTTTAGSDGLQTGADTDFGFFIKAGSLDIVEPIDSVYWFVTYAYDKSPAGLAGVQRGWYINKINGSNIRYDEASVNTLNNLFFGNTNSASFEFIKPDGSKVTSNLSKAAFISNSVLYTHIFDNPSAGKKVGYLVFNQFFDAPSRQELVTAFSAFQSGGINELIVDLRYNPGGSTATQDTLANLIAPLATNDKTMYQYIFNTTLQNNQHQLIRKKLGYGNAFTAGANTVKFKKAGNLNLSRVFFIVGSGSASASELLINNLKPYMEVKIIGDTTYGKPVGFFGIPIYEYVIYPTSFKTVNSVGNADFYSGFAPDKLAPDGVNRNWGDLEEPSLAHALNYIVTGTFGRKSSKLNDLQMKAQQQTKPVLKSFLDKKFSGMILERK